MSNSSKLQVNASAAFNASFGIILKGDEDDRLIILAQNCAGNCAKSKTLARKLRVECNANDARSANVTVAAGTTLEQAAIQIFQDTGFGNVTAKNDELLVITLLGSISKFNMQVQKNCSKFGAKDLISSDVMKCEEGQEVIYDNELSLSDNVLKKRGFQFAVGQIKAAADFEMVGSAKATCSVLRAFEVVAELDVYLEISVDACLNDAPGLLPFSDWLGALTAVFNKEADAHREGFLTAGAVVNGGFNASVEASYPFEMVSANALGHFNNPWEINFLEVSKAGKPNITLDVDLPKIGSLKNLSFRDMVELLKRSLYLLVGPDDVKSCKGGLLGHKAFSFKIPLLGVSVCSVAKGLEFLVEAVEAITDETGTKSLDDLTTFNLLERKLQNLLADSFEGDSRVNLTADSSSERAQLELDIELKWDFKEDEQLNIDLKTIAPKDASDLADYAQNLVAGKGQAGYLFEADAYFRLGLGLEYVKAEKKINPYILGTTAFKTSLSASGEFDYDVQAGPFRGGVDAKVSLGGTTPGERMSITVGLNESQRYYLSNPGPVVAAAGDPTVEVVDGISGLIKKVDVAFDAQVAGDIDVSLFIGVSLSVDVRIMNLDKYFRGDRNESVFFFDYNLTVPNFKIPSFLDLLLTEPKAIIEALDNFFKSAEDMTLGPNGLITNFPVRMNTMCSSDSAVCLVYSNLLVS